MLAVPHIYQWTLGPQLRMQQLQVAMIPQVLKCKMYFSAGPNGASQASSDT